MQVTGSGKDVMEAEKDFFRRMGWHYEGFGSYLEVLKNLGDEGWELVAITGDEPKTWWFKRKID